MLLDLLAPNALPSYEAPPWLPAHLPVPAHKLQLGHLPTPIHRWALPGAGDTQLFVKRDDCSGCELSGNKVRKLEFLLAQAIAEGCDTVITAGGIQSNHCRASSAAARRVGLTPHIILRTAQPEDDPGLVGNLLIDTVVGAEVHLVGPEEWNAKGAWRLITELKAKLEAGGAKAFGFPTGGSNALGTWGYVNAVRELQLQLGDQLHVDRIYFGCGSGGTAAGLGLGLHYAGMLRENTELVGLGVDDTPDVFYDKIDGLYAELGATADGEVGGPPLESRKLMRLEQAVGEGYAQTTEPELEFIARAARATGIVLDPCYSGKAALGMARDLQARPCKTALFIHTGGMLGLYDKVGQLAPVLKKAAGRK